MAKPFSTEERDALCNRVCELLADHGRLDVCVEKMQREGFERVPVIGTFQHWQRHDPLFREAYRTAREQYAEKLFHDARVTAESVDLEGKNASARVNKARLMCDLYMKQAAILAPHMFAEVKRQEHSGPNGGPIQYHQRDFESMSDEDLDKEIAELERRTSRSKPLH